MAKNNKRLRLFAGPNGSGKSTLFREFSKEYKEETGFFVNADQLEKELAEKGLVDLREIGLSATQKDLDDFKLRPDSISLFKKAESEGHIIDFYIKENCIVDRSKDAHSYEGSFIASFIRFLLTSNNKSFSFETVMSHESKISEVKMNLQQKTGQKVKRHFCVLDFQNP